MNYFSFIIQKVTLLGIPNLLLYLPKRLYFAWLQKKFHFDKWHAATPFEARSYKKLVVQLAAKLDVESVVEVGCGLGEIVSRIPAKKRYGIDRDLNVIMAAKHLHSHSCDFINLDLDEFLTKSPITSFNLLIMVNWVHEIPWVELKQRVHEIHKKFGNKFLIIDALEINTSGFQNYHTEAQIRTLGEIVEVIENVDLARSIYVVDLS